MFNFVKKLFDYNEKEVNRYRQTVEEINLLENRTRKLKDSDFPRETEKLKAKLDLSWAFALVREAARRVLKQRHFDVQLIAGLALYEGKISEQKTGEGKTLSATSALYTHALAGRGAHLVTVNDYLTRRDAGWMGGVFHLLGMTTSAIISEQSFLYDPHFKDEKNSDWRLTNLRPITRQEAYRADITYGINSEYGFDYLRDNMAGRSSDLVQRGYYFAVIDEADSVLIDEARTPHIISAPNEEETSKYYKYPKLIKQLDSKEDYIIDEKLRTANLTEVGIAHIESLLGMANIYEKDFETLFHIEAALKAELLFKIDKDYIVKDGEVIIVDEFTGRLLYGRRFSEGIHQAIEAKENVDIKRESKNLATVSLQNYFRMYEKLAGMTGTAATEAEEFHKIYNVDVVVVPTHREMVRKDHADVIYKTERAKFQAVVEEIAQNYKKGRPVLVGTTSIEKNEYLSRLLNQKGVKHELLNAKNHEREAQIIEKAGERGAVTVATNMAGRGVDIVLGKGVTDLGGLYVIGTERHESRRIDNQLRGRSGRQGDPGESKFFVSLEDDLMRIFGGEQISNLMTFLKFPEDQPLTHAMVSKAIEQAQVKVEGFNFDTRKHLVDYDDVLNKQREIIYSLRQKTLKLPEENIREFTNTVMEVFNEDLTSIITQHSAIEVGDKEGMLLKELELIHNFKKDKITKFIKSEDMTGLTQFIQGEIKDEYGRREKKIGRDIWNSIVQSVFLSTIDKYWTEHLTAIDDLREGINLRGYAQLDPLVEYKNEAFSMFERLLSDINFEVTRRIFKIDTGSIMVTGESTKEERDEHALIYHSASAIDPFTSPPPKDLSRLIPIKSGSNRDLPTSQNVVSEEISPDEQPVEIGGFKIIPPGSKNKKPGRNDPCWCGSVKKYKKCHYPN